MEAAEQTLVTERAEVPPGEKPQRHQQRAPMGEEPGTPLTPGSLPSRPQVCWLAPKQTAGKQKPYMYTQGQAVLNRSFFPCFDTPSVKFTYSATVQVSSAPGSRRGRRPSRPPHA